MTFGLFAWVLLPLIPALIALYFLKLKRQERVISSTFLWTRSLEDLHVNAPFQKMRRSLLLLLQLLILAFVILAASKPMLSGTSVSGITRILLIDRSASMNVQEAGGTRLDLAKDKALGLIDAMLPEDLTAIITFADRSELLEPLTGEAGPLRDAIESIEPTSLPTSLPEALETAASMSEASQSAEIYVVSDGGFGDVKGLAPELELLNIKYVAIGTRVQNVGITELDVRRSFGREKRTEIFVSAFNAGGEKQTTTLSLYEGDVLKDAVELQIGPGKAAAHVFDGAEHSGETLRLELDRGGALPDDDRAWVRVDPTRPVDVLVAGRKNVFLENALRVNSYVKARRVQLGTLAKLLEDGRFEDDPAEVVIFDGECLKTPLDRPAIYFGCLPDLSALVAAGARADAERDPGANGAESENGAPEIDENAEKTAPAGDATAPKSDVLRDPQIIDWERGHPVNRFLSFADVGFVESKRLPEGSRFKSIIDGGDGSLASVVTLTPAGKPAVSVLLVGPALLNDDWTLNTNWPTLPSFPIFVSNAINWLGTTSGHEQPQRYRTGETLAFRPPPLPEDEESADMRFVGPGDREHVAVVEGSGDVLFGDTSLTGVYTLFDGDDVLREFPVSLLHRAESIIAPAEKIRFGAQREATPEELPETRDLWKWFALAGLAIVLTEWWVYNRRMTL